MSVRETYSVWNPQTPVRLIFENFPCYYRITESIKHMREILHRVRARYSRERGRGGRELFVRGDRIDIISARRIAIGKPDFYFGVFGDIGYADKRGTVRHCRVCILSRNTELVCLCVRGIARLEAAVRTCRGLI